MVPHACPPVLLVSCSPAAAVITTASSSSPASASASGSPSASKTASKTAPTATAGSFRFPSACESESTPPPSGPDTITPACAHAASARGTAPANRDRCSSAARMQLACSPPASR